MSLWLTNKRSDLNHQNSNKRLLVTRHKNCDTFVPYLQYSKKKLNNKELILIEVKNKLILKLSWVGPRGGGLPYETDGDARRKF